MSCSTSSASSGAEQKATEYGVRWGHGLLVGKKENQCAERVELASFGTQKKDKFVG